MKGQTKYFLGIACSLSFVFTSCDNEVKQSNTPVQNVTIPALSFGQNSSEISALETQLAKDSLNIQKRLDLGSMLYASKQFEKAIYHFSLVHSIDKKNVTALISLGNLYYDTQQNEKAIEFYEKALVLDAKNINVRCDMATCYLNINNAEKAMKILQENIAIDNNHAQSHHNLSVIYKKLGKVIEAEEELKIYHKLNQ